MGYPNMKCMYITIYVHNMDIDLMFDYINGRVNVPPSYWINPRDLPITISGGFLEISIGYDTYVNIREIKMHSTWHEV